MANQRLFLRSIAELEARPIPGTENPTGGITNPVFSPDGQSLVFFSSPPGVAGTIKKIAAFQSDREKDLAIFWQRADTSGTAERLTKPDEGTSHVPESWSPDGSRFLFSVTKGWTWSLRDKKADRFDEVESPNPIGSVFSPNGQWIAYSISERPGAGSDNLFVQPFPPTGAKYQLSKNGGHHPMWSPDGKELFYQPGLNQIVVVAVQTRPTFSFGNPVALQGGTFGSISPVSMRNRDIAPDGKRFITPVNADQSQGVITAAPEIRVVVNWFEELKQRVPVP